MWPNNTVTIEDDHHRCTRINISRCLRLKERPEYLVYDDGVDDAISTAIRGPDAEKEGDAALDSILSWLFTENENTGVTNFDTDVNHDLKSMEPIRRNNRVRKRPQRLIEVMVITDANKSSFTPTQTDETPERPKPSMSITAVTDGTERAESD